MDSNLSHTLQQWILLCFKKEDAAPKLFPAFEKIFHIHCQMVERALGMEDTLERILRHSDAQILRDMLKTQVSQLFADYLSLLKFGAQEQVFECTQYDSEDFLRRVVRAYSINLGKTDEQADLYSWRIISLVGEGYLYSEAKLIAQQFLKAYYRIPHPYPELQGDERYCSHHSAMAYAEGFLRHTEKNGPKEQFVTTFQNIAERLTEREGPETTKPNYNDVEQLTHRVLSGDIALDSIPAKPVEVHPDFSENISDPLIAEAVEDFRKRIQKANLYPQVVSNDFPGPLEEKDTR